MQQLRSQTYHAKRDSNPGSHRTRRSCRPLDHCNCGGGGEGLGMKGGGKGNQVPLYFDQVWTYAAEWKTKIVQLGERALLQVLAERSCWRFLTVVVLVNYLLLEALDLYTVVYNELPTDLLLSSICTDIRRRLTSIFLMGANQKRPFHGGQLFLSFTSYNTLNSHDCYEFHFKTSCATCCLQFHQIAVVDTCTVKFCRT